MFCQFHRASTWNLEMIPLVDIFPQLDPYELLWVLLPEVLDSLGPSNESQVEREMFPTVRLNYLGYLIVVDLTQLQCLCCKKIWRLRETHAKRSFLLCGWVLHFTQVEEPSHRLTFLLLLFVAWDIHGLAMSGGWIISWTLSINSLSSSRLLCCVFSKDPSHLYSLCSTTLWCPGFSLCFPCNLALHTLLFQSQFVSQNGRDCLSRGEELCPGELFWSDKQTAADWIGTGLALLPPGLNWVQEHSHAGMMGLGSRAAPQSW